MLGKRIFALAIESEDSTKGKGDGFGGDVNGYYVAYKPITLL